MSTSILPWHSLPRWCERTWALAKVRPVMSSEGLIIAGSVYFSLFSNAMFWRSAAPALPSQWLWAASLFLLVTAVHGVWLSVLVWEHTARIVLTALLLVSALAGHYMAAYGIYIDADMIRNVLHTDWREASELAGMDSVLSLLPSLPPIVLVWRVKVQRRS
jgi:lipid A ethanolaminephosphotransferase